MGQTVYLHWRDANRGDGSGWDQLRCLYAYRGLDGEILYIGKAWGNTVRQRWEFDAKPKFWRDLKRQRRIYEHSTVVGTLALFPGERLTAALLSDVESLLIHKFQPWGNIQCRKSRIQRPGLDVRCKGDWSHIPRVRDVREFVATQKLR